MKKANRFLLLFCPIWLITIKAGTVSAQEDYLSAIEREIRFAGKKSADYIISSHPRLWAIGEEEWDDQKVGSLAWRIVHGELLDPESPANDQAKYEFMYLAYLADDPEMYGVADNGTFSRRFLWTILAGHARKYGWDQKLPSSLDPYSSGGYHPQHTADEYYADARNKLLALAKISGLYEWPYWICIYGSIGYDWLLASRYSSDDPVLSSADQKFMQQVLIQNAEYVKSRVNGKEHFFIASEMANYVYCMVGLALYEPERISDPTYAEQNSKALEYLQDFDNHWIGKIIPAMNAQGGDGGWHGTFEFMMPDFDAVYSGDSVLPWHLAPILFAHYTATRMPIEKSIYSTGFMKHGVEFQNQMIKPDGTYYPPAPPEDARMPWIAPLRMNSRRRFSQDADQKKIAELGAWVRNIKSPGWFVNAGSYDLFEQTIFEEKWINPQPPQNLGFADTRLFGRLGWVFHCSDFARTDSPAFLFVCQRYNWSTLDPYAQNSLFIHCRGDLIHGHTNTMLFNGKGQRQIDNFPTMSDGVAAYAPDSQYDIGPGILTFQSNEQFDLILGDASNAFPHNEVKKYLRGIVHLKAERLIVVVDKAVTATNILKTWAIDPIAAPQKLEQETIKISNSASALFVRRLLPVQVTVLQQNEAKYAISSSADADSLFLHILQIADANQTLASPEILVDEAQLIDSPPGSLGMRIRGWNIFFHNDRISLENGALEVSLVSFTGEAADNGVLLHWSTLSENNNLGFEIERRIEGEEYKRIGFIKGHGEALAAIDYEFLDKNIETGLTYYYRLKQINTDGSFTYSETIVIAASLPMQAQLEQNFPNPFNPNTTIDFQLNEACRVLLTIYDLNGRHVATLVEQDQPAGLYHIKWSGKDNDGMMVPTGIYIYRLQIPSQTILKKMIFIR
jgi:hypothetical protein